MNCPNCDKAMKYRDDDCFSNFMNLNFIQLNELMQ